MSSIADVAFGFGIGGAVVCLILGYLLDRERVSQMRPEEEVRSLVTALSVVNQNIESQLATAPEEGIGSLSVFNMNSTLLCALKWTLGEDTIKHTRKV